MTPTEAIRAIRKSKYACAVALADAYGRKVSLYKLTPTNSRRFDKWLSQDDDYRQRFVGVYNKDSSYKELMGDILFTAREGLAA